VIVKPPEADKEDPLRAAVGTVIDGGAKVHSAAKTVGRAGSKAVLYYFAAVMMFGFLFSSIPFWFKALVCAGLYLLYRKTRKPKTPQSGPNGKAFN
jgi:hypothetical protein